MPLRLDPKVELAPAELTKFSLVRVVRGQFPPPLTNEERRRQFNIVSAARRPVQLDNFLGWPHQKGAA